VISGGFQPGRSERIFKNTDAVCVVFY